MNNKSFEEYVSTSKEIFSHYFSVSKKQYDV